MSLRLRPRGALGTCARLPVIVARLPATTSKTRTPRHTGQVDEHELAVFGLQRRVGYKEARRVLNMRDAEAAAWHKDNPAVQSALE